MNEACVLTPPKHVKPEYAEPSPRRWTARLDLHLAQQRDGRTRLTHCEHTGPLRVQRLFHPDESGSAHCYLLHPPGGVATGDELTINVSLASGRALLTTPSAGRFYTVGDLPFRQLQRVALRVDDGHLQWLPQETIIFSGANAHLDTYIDLSETANLSFWDVVALGKPACDEPFDTGAVTQQLHIQRAGHTVFRDRIELQAGDRLHRSRLGLNDCSTFGTLVMTAEPTEELLDRWLGKTAAAEGEFCVTQRGEILIARYLGDDAQHCRQHFAALVNDVAEQCFEETLVVPRIWHT